MQDHTRLKDVGGFLNKCNSFCDDVLTKLGVRLDDKSSRLVWKIVDLKEIKKEMEQKDLKQQ